MNQIAFYSRVQLDPQFRKEKIGEARYQTKIAAGLAVVGVASWLSYVTYAAISEKRWPGDVGVILLLVLCASSYSQAVPD